MTQRPYKSHEISSQGAWPAFLLLVLGVAVPTACILWFMSQAMRNERLAFHQRLAETSRNQLLAAQNRLDAWWKNRAATLTKIDLKTDAAATFADCVRSGTGHSILLYSPDGRLRYPNYEAGTAHETETRDDAMEQAAQLANDPARLADAASAYAAIAGSSPSIHVAAQALQAQARCLARAGQRDAAVHILVDALSDAKYARATDATGRLVVPNSRLLALELIRDPGNETFKRITALLREQLEDYAGTPMPPAQRRFLMEQLQRLVPELPPFTTLAAEQLAANYIEAREAVSPSGASWSLSLNTAPVPGTGQTPQLVTSPASGFWQLASPHSHAVALYEFTRLTEEMLAYLAVQVPLTDARFELIGPVADAPKTTPLIEMPASSYMPSWRLALHLSHPESLGADAERQRTVYLWTAVLVILVIAVTALLIGSYVGRQMKLTRLKNDLIATVSHELKTPLASVRILVDTLLDNQCGNPQQTREYLAMISSENTRLCRLVENFLTFSRMERGKQTLMFAEIDPKDIVKAAVDTVKDRWSTEECRFDVETAGPLPTIHADRDAMVTVLLNLLENAYKYSDNPKHIQLRATAFDGHVCFEVRDNGIGISRRAMKRIFDRFYQVDQSLSRKAGGCGLGLSIVKYIVDAHGGEVAVTSQPGKGSVFTVKIPARQEE